MSVASRRETTIRIEICVRYSIGLEFRVKMSITPTNVECCRRDCVVTPISRHYCEGDKVILEY